MDVIEKIVTVGNDDRRTSKIEVEFERRISSRRASGDRRTLE